MPLLEVKNLTVRYNPDDPSPALDAVSFSSERGERLALIGNNGAGKSTLLLSLPGLLPPECGGVFFDGMELNRSSAAAFRRRIGFVMQNPDDQLFMPTVYDDISFGLRSQTIPEETVQKKTHQVMAALGIEALAQRLTHRISGGEKRLAALAGVLVTEPDMLLLDEPATFLDKPGRERLIEILAGLSQAMIIATHDLAMAERLCRRALCLDHGRVTADYLLR